MLNRDFQILITAEQDESRYWFGIWNGPVSSQAGNSVPYPQFIFSMNSSSSHLFPRGLFTFDMFSKWYLFKIQ